MRLLTTIFLWLAGIAAWLSGLPIEQPLDTQPEEAPLSPTRPKAEAAVRMPNSQLRAWMLAQCGFL